MADEETRRPEVSRLPGWYPAGSTPNEQLYWDGRRWTGRRRWVHSAWVDVPLEDPGGPAPRKRERRWSTTTVVLVVVALAGLGGIAFAVMSATGSAPKAKSTTPATTTTKPVPTSTPTSVAIQQASEAQVAACESDAKNVETALAAFQAQHGAYPVPASPWSAAAYDANYLPLTSAGAEGGPYLPVPPATTHYIVEYDSSGHVWVAPPGAYDTYDAGQDFDVNPDVCTAAIG